MVTAAVRLVRPLAVGGMGTVWVADHTTLETQVAVKIMAAELTENPEVAQRFSREAAASARVKSPHVVQVFDHGITADGLPFIVMELLDGQDLGHLLDGNVALDPSLVVEIVTQTCKALSRAHAAGVIHRDIKPDNIFVCDTDGGEPFVKLLDFGIAKSEAGPTSMKVTAPGSVFGTPLYMSPEQLVGEPTDFRTDLWSLGVVAFEALTGTAPYEGESIGAVALAAHAPLPKPTSRRADLPDWVDAWFSKACALAPGDRFESAADMAKAMREVALVSSKKPTLVSQREPSVKSETAPMATTMVPNSRNPPDPGKGGPGAKLGAAVALLGVLAVVGFVLTRNHTEPPPVGTPPPPAPPSAPAAVASSDELPWLPAPATSASAASPPPLASGRKPASRPHGTHAKPAEYNDIK